MSELFSLIRRAAKRPQRGYFFKYLRICLPTISPSFATSAPGNDNKAARRRLCSSMHQSDLPGRLALVKLLFFEHRIGVDKLGDDVEIWRIRATDIGVDKIGNQAELKAFYGICVDAIDKIGLLKEKNVEINVFSAVCNSLAITFGRAIFAKSHNNINIYDAVKENGVVKDVCKLSL